MQYNLTQKTKRDSSDTMQENTTKKRKTDHKITNNNTNSSNKGWNVKLYCPAVSKMAEMMAWEGQKLDLGTIARTFGLEPGTLRLNGHFISRGVDLVASSVTWNSLLSFFYSKGLSTGCGASGALIVDGKLSKPGTKRAHSLAEVENRMHCIKRSKEYTGVATDFQHEDINPSNIKEFKDHNNVCEKSRVAAKLSSDMDRLKRKHWLENISPVKRIRVNGSCSDESQERGHSESYTSKLQCGYQLCESVKRMREDEVIVAAPSKRMR